MVEWSDKELGLHLPIARRDFIGGVAAGAALAAAPSALAQAASAPASADAGSADYPPLKQGLRGQYPGSFEAAHMARDGDFTGALAAEDSGEHYDLVIVGGGISGLSAAYFYRQALGDDRKILILDNHDDFGGHAKRNEFHYEGRTILAYGGTMSIESPFPYSFTSKKLLADLGVDLTSYERYETKAYDGLGSATFFDKEHFLADKLVTGTGKKPWPQFFAEAPLTGTVRADLTRLYTDKKNYLPDMNPEARAEYLRHISYQDYLTKHAGVLPESLPFFSGQYFRNNKRVDTLPAWEAALGGRMPALRAWTCPSRSPPRRSISIGPMATPPSRASSSAASFPARSLQPSWIRKASSSRPRAMPRSIIRPIPRACASPAWSSAPNILASPRARPRKPCASSM